MNQKQIGNFIAQKRKEKNLTQMQLAEILGVSNKTIYGFLVIVLGVTFLVFSRLLGGTNFTDFFSGVFLGLSIGLMLIGIYTIGKNLKV